MALIAVFVGSNTAKEFGGTPVLGGAVAAVVVYAGVSRIEVFGQELRPGQGGVLGALAAAFLATRVERWCRRHVPEAVDVLVTPTLTVLVAGLATVYGLMYAAGEAAEAIGTAADRLLAHGGAVAGFVLGGLFLPLVMLGLHQALIPLHATLIEQQGHTVLLPVLAMAGAGQVECGGRGVRCGCATTRRCAAPSGPRCPPGCWAWGTADLRRDPAARPPVRDGVPGRRGRRRSGRPVRHVGPHGRLDGDRPVRLGAVPPARRPRRALGDGRRVRRGPARRVRGRASPRRTSGGCGAYRRRAPRPRPDRRRAGSGGGPTRGGRCGAR